MSAAAFVQVQINGADPDQAPLSEVEIEQKLNDHWRARVVFRSTPDLPPDIPSMIGRILNVSAFDGTGAEHTLFSGSIIDGTLKYEVTGSFGAQLDAVSASWRMDRSGRYGYYLKQPPDDIAATLTSKYSLGFTGSIAGDANLSRVQWDESDWRFLLRLVDDGEAWLRPTATGIETGTSFFPGPQLSWREGEYDLLEFTGGALLQPIVRGGAHYDHRAMQSRNYSSTKSEPSFYGSWNSLTANAISAGQAQPEQTVTNRHRVATLDSYQQELEKESRRSALNLCRYEGVSRNPAVTAGGEVTVSGVDGVVDGTYGVIACTHRWTPRGYENRFQATTARRWFQPAKIEPRRVAGLVPARVTANYDPHNEGRLQVHFYWQEQNATTWVRLITGHAGADRGHLLVPEIGDEVAVQFEEGDPERPYVLGSVWNGMQQPPSEGFWQGGTNNCEFEGNNIKRLVTKSGIRITLVDTPGQETIALATPRSNRIVMTEKANETGRPAIAAHTEGDIIVSAPGGRIHLASATCSREVGSGGIGSQVVVPVLPKVIQIDAKLPGTSGLRDPNNKRADNNLKSSTSSAESLSANSPVILVRGCHQVELTATTTPPGKAVSWQVKPNENTNAAPAIAPIDGGKKAKLSTNSPGSFSVTATLAGSKVVWNVVFVWVDVKVDTSSIKTQNHYFGAGPGLAASGEFAKGKYTWDATVQVHLSGGGNNGKLGIDKVTLHVLQNGVADTLTGHYAPPPPDSTAREQPRGGLPVLDSNTPADPLLLPNLGARVTPNDSVPDRTVWTGDSPEGGFPLRHLYTGTMLESISGINGFRTAIVSVSDDARTELMVHAAVEWQAHFDGDFDRQGKYTPRGAHTSSQAQFSLIKAGTGGEDARDAGFETFKPTFNTGTNTLWNPKHK